MKMEEATANHRLEKIGEKIRQWRETRAKKGKIPLEMWEEATIVAKELGTYRVAKALGLDFSRLKRRIRPDEESQKIDSPQFVELSHRSSPLSILSNETTVEVAAKDGARLTFRMKGAHTSELLDFMKTFHTLCP